MNEQLQTVLKKLSEQIRRYVMIEGVALVVIVMGLFFWGSLIVDYVYFSICRLELPVLFRQIALTVMLLGTAYCAMIWLVSRMTRPLSDRELALILEKRFGAIDDRLITAVELSKTPPPETPMSKILMSRTIREVTDVVAGLNLSQVFNHFPLRRALTLAVIIAVSVGVLFVNYKPVFARWVNGYVLLKDRYWLRNTELRMQVIAQPGDRIKDFHGGIYKHARGEDLTLLVSNLEGSLVPERVTMSYRTEDGSFGRITMSTIEKGVYRHIINHVQQSMEIHITGGDFTTISPYRIEVVDPPLIDAMTLYCQYPVYTGKNSPDASPLGTKQQVQGLSATLPVGTKFYLQAKTNKPLVAAEIRTETMKLRLQSMQHSNISTTIDDTRQWDQTLTFNPEISGNVKDDMKAMELTLLPEALSLSRDTKTMVFFAEVMSNDRLPEYIKEFNGEDNKPLPIGQDVQFKIYLEDTDGILSLEPGLLKIIGQLDEPPSIEVIPKGVSNVITRRATIPYTGTIRDDYGLVKAQFLYGLNKTTPDIQLPLKNAVAGLKEVKLGTTIENAERFEVLPLNLDVGQKISIAIAAEDADSVTGPHQSIGGVTEFTIVSNEELLSLLYQKELNLRRRFEQIFTEIESLKKDLQVQQTKYDAAIAQGPNIQPEVMNAVTSCAERTVFAIRQKAVEVQEVQESFIDIREELVNNNIDSQTMLDRLNDKIIEPLENINKDNFPQLDSRASIFRLVMERNQDPREAMTGTSLEMDRLLRELEKILNEMRKLETFHEAVELLKAIIKNQEEIKKQTEEEKKKKLIDLQDLR